MNKSMALTLTVLMSGSANAEIEMTVGDGLIDGTRIEDYSFTWRQCAVQEGEWYPAGSLAEELVVIGPVVRHRQAASQAQGVRVQSDTYFERSTFAPLRIETQATRGGERVLSAVRHFTKSGYSGEEVRGEKHKVLSGTISSEMLHGTVMGLPLATMNYQHEPVTFLASMVAFDGTYDVTATWVGGDTLDVNGKEVEAWMIDVEWLHRETGDVYAPGPDGSGGRYWVVPDPPAGVPYVPRYQTDSYAVEFVEGVCPTNGS